MSRLAPTFTLRSLAALSPKSTCAGCTLAAQDRGRRGEGQAELLSENPGEEDFLVVVAAPDLASCITHVGWSIFFVLG
eukprot:768610-Hanusia_phi.AAC.1